MSGKKSSDISVTILEQLVKTHGDGIVVAYVRYRKLKACKGYKEACKKAGLFSKIKGGRRLEGGKYAVIVKFRAIVFLIIPAILLLISGIRRMATRAENREPETGNAIEVIEPIEDTGVCDEKEYEILYMDIPGYSDMVLNDVCREIILYNPENNPCNLGFAIRIGETTVYESERLAPGRITEADFYDRLKRGIYEMQIITTGYTETGEELNSVCQNIILTIE